MIPSIPNSNPVVLTLDKVPPFEAVPQEIVSFILENSFIPEKSLLPGVVACRLTCKQWNQILNNNGLWESLLKNHFPSVDVDTKTVKNFHNAYQAFHNLYLNLPKEVYALGILQGHTDTVYCTAVTGNLLSSGCRDGTIKVWDTRTGECLRTLQGHTDVVCHIAVTGDLLFSGSRDGTIKIWNIQTGKWLGDLQGHTNPVDCLAFEANSEQLFSSSLDHTIKVWNTRTGECLRTLQRLGFEVSSIAVNSKRFFSSGSYNNAINDDAINVWDTRTGECLKAFQGHTSKVYCLTITGNLLFSGSRDGAIKAWDTRTGECLRTFQGHTSTVYCLAITGKLLFSTSLDRTIKVWDTRTGECLGTLQEHIGRISCLAVDGGKLFLTADSNNIERRDLTASQDTILEEIAGILKTGTTAQAIQCALNRFSRMSNGVKNAIYGELYKICKPFANDYWGCGEHAFLNQYGQSSTPDQQAQAIENYLKDRSLNK